VGFFIRGGSKTSGSASRGGKRVDERGEKKEEETPRSKMYTGFYARRLLNKQVTEGSVKKRA